MQILFRKKIDGILTLLAIGLVWGGAAAWAQVQPITGISVTYGTISNTNDNYSTTGGGSAGFPTGTVYNVRFNEGTSNITYLAGVVIGGVPFNAAALAPQINIARATNAPATGTLHIVLYEQSSYSGTNVFLKTSYQRTMEDSLRSQAINLGADNVFSDEGDANGNNNNIQRIDYLFPDGIPVYNRIQQRGFLVMDRGGNDRFKIAAVKGLDGNGKPSAYGPSVSVLETQWGNSGRTLDTIVMRGYTENGDVQHPSADVDVQPLSGVFASLQTLGLQTNDFIYGYSLVANDTTTNSALWANVQNPVNFPTNTSPDSTFGGLDLISGGMVFYDAVLNATLGDRAWDDLNANGIQDAGEPGISNVLVYVYDNATNLVATRRTDTNGFWTCKDNGPGTFYAKYFCPTGYESTLRYVGTNTAIDSDADLTNGRTAAITLTNSQTNLTLDAGMYRRAMLGDTTWEDRNGDGQQNGGEPALSNVVVRLYNATSNLLGTTTSSVAGAYTFTNLLPGAYFVAFTPPAGYLFTTSNLGDDATDSDPLPGTNRTALVTLISGQMNTTVDAGFYRPASLGDFTWIDNNVNGQQDNGEPALSNVVVTLYNAATNAIGTTTSSSAGAYAFTNLVPGSYFVGFGLPAGYLFTTSNVGADATDSDPLPGTNRTAQITLVSGQTDVTVDAGFVRPASLGDFTWVDSNANGQQDVGEPALSNVVVRLYNAASNVIGTTTSSVAGAYAFTNLFPASYFVGFTAPAGYALTVANAGADATDSDADAAIGFTALVALTNGQVDLTVDAGFFQPASIGNTTWVDANYNGQQDDGGAALSNVVVRLYDAASNVIGTTTSSVAGIYAFTNLPPGSYFVSFTPPAGYALTVANTGADATDSDADEGTGRTGFYTLTSGQTDNSVDAGFYDTTNVSLKLFKSTSLSSNWDFGATNDYYLTIQNTGSVALAGIKLSDALPPGAMFVPGSAQIVQMLAVTTNPFTQSVSDGFGTAAYTNNDGTINWAGNWTEVGDNALATGGNVLVRVAGTTNALVFENAAATNDYVTRTNALTVVAGRTYTNVTLNFAYRREAWDAGDTFTLFVSTNGFAAQSNLVFSVPTTAGTDANYVQITTNLTSRMGAQMALRLRAGAGFSAGDRINFDFVTFTNSGYDISTNTMLTYSTGVAVNVISNLAAATPTNLLSNYTLPAGSSVTVRIRATLGAPLVSTQLVNVATATNPVTPPLVASVTNVAAANAVGNQAWVDANGNGLQDGGETGLTGVTVRIYSAASNLLATTTTGVGGTYSFTNLPTGLYFLEFVPPVGYWTTLLDQGGNDAVDSDIAPATGRTAVFSLSGGTNDTSRDAGFYQMASLGDFAWVDANVNGQQDGGEAALSNVVVTLYNATSNVIGTTTSSVTGAYAFTNLVPGSYFVAFTPPAGYLFTTSNVGADATDSDPLAGTNRTAVVTLVSGQTDTTVDAGFYRPASLGDFAWVDANVNGQQDGGESGLAGVVVTLYNAASNVVGTTTSSVAGAYAFTNLMPGSYFVVFALPSGYLFTTANTGSDTTDSDADAGTGRTALIALTNGQADVTVDAGFYRPASLGDTTWVDNNGNGQQDGGEPALPNVVVTLYNAASNVIGTTTSSVAGIYAFTNLFPGSYFVSFTPPAGYLFTTSNVGSDATDSDPLAGTNRTAVIVLTNGQANITVDAGFYNPADVSMKLFKSTSLTNNWDYGVTNDYYLTVQNTGTVALTGLALTDLLPPGVTFVPSSAAIVQMLTVTTNPFTETVSDGFGTAAYSNNDGTVNWLGDWTEVGDGTPGVPTGGSVLVRVAGGTNALVFELANADNDYVTRTNRLSSVPGRVYTNSMLSFAYRRENWDNNDFMTFYVSTNGFASQSNLVYTVPSQVITDAAYTNISTNITSFMGTNLSVRVRASANFAAGDRVNFDFITITHTGYDVATTAIPKYSSGVTVNVVSNLASATPTNLLSNYTLAAGSSVTVRIRATLDVPLVSSQFVNVATATNALTPPAWASVTNVSVLNSVGDRAWVDANVNGIQDGGELGLAGVTVRIYSAASNLLATTTSSVAGAYAFTNLPSGSYFLEFTKPTDYVVTLQDQGGNDAVDSDIAPATGRTAVFALSGGTNDTSWDAGFYLPASAIGNFVWRDVNGNGIQDGGSETGMPGVVVRLYDAASNLVATTNTSAAGLYAFTNVPTATYFLEFVAPTNYMFILQDQGGNDAVDSDASPATGRTVPFFLPPGTNDVRWDAGLWEIVNGLRLTKTSDAGSCLSPGDTITYTLTIQNTGTVTHAGIALEDPLPAGLAYVPGSVNWTGGTLATSGPPPTLLTNLTLTTGQTATVTFHATVNLPSSVTQLLNIATAHSPVQPAIYAAVTNCVNFADVGVEKFVTDSTPDLLETIEYTLVASNNGPAVATGVVLTDVLPPQVQYNSHSNGTYDAGSGKWTIGTLAAGASTTLYVNVTVRENTSGLHITNTATVTGRDLFDPNPSNDTSSVVIIPNPGVDIGNRVWFDANRDGIQNANETNGIPFIPVALLDTNGNVRATTTTDPEGDYLFKNMPSGTYLVRFDLATLTTNETLSTSKVGDDDDLDSDAVVGNVGDYAWTAAFSVRSGQTTYAIDLGITTRGSTRAEVAEMWGEWTGGEGRVAWRTDSEFGTAGFFVYRVDPKTGAETRLNRLLLPSAFQESGATYWLADPEARKGETGTYRLEEKELSGEIRNLGTQVIRFDVPKVPTKLSRLEARTTPAAAAPVVRAVARTLAGHSPVQKVLVRNDGVYGVDLQTLADGMGLSLEAVRTLAETNGLMIVKQGAPVPAIYDAVRGRLVFRGEAPAPNWYVHDSAYLISAGEGCAMSRREPGASNGTTAFPVQLHFEQDLFLFSMNQTPDDFYFWIPVMSGYGDLSVNPIPLDLSGYAGGDLTLKVRLMGWTSSTNYPDHLARFRFNGTEAGSIAFDGQNPAEAVLVIPAAVVLNGVNTLTVEGVLQSGYTESFFVVDWVEAAFERQLAPRADTAFFSANGAASISAAAFAEPLALALGDDGETTWIADENGELPAKAWAASSENERFATIEADAVPLLVPEPAAADAWFLSRTNRIDYLVITSRALAPASQELADYRASQGLRVGVAVFEDICDLMTGGERTPEAIPELLSYAAATWARAPQMVVLMGNGHYDYLGVNTSEANHLPPMLIQTPSGICASDNLLADAGGDDLPDVAMGRLPARTPADLTAMIAKIKAYEAGFGSAWQNQLVFVSDKADSAGNFREANTRLGQMVAAPYTVPERIELDTLAIGTARTRLLNRFKTGAGFIHYTGHGGPHNYSSQNLLKETDIAAMTNAVRPSVAVALSCLVGRFEVPATTSLGEMLMQRAAGGAVAVLGPSGLSQNSPATELGEAFYRSILQERTGRLGLAFLQARRALPGTLFTKESMSVYNLLGDPALRIAGNDVTETPPVLAQIHLQNLEQIYDGTGRGVTVATEPTGLAVDLTYDGRAAAPTNAGAYAVVATIFDADFEGSATGTLVVSKAIAAVTLNGLSQTYDGDAKPATAQTEPAGLAVKITYDDSVVAPAAVGTYAVIATVNDSNYEGRATGTLVVEPTAVIISFGGLAQVYNGSSRSVTATTDPPGLAVVLTYNGSETPPRNAGSYVVVGRVDDVLYEGVATAVLVVAKAAAAVKLDALSRVYNGQPKQVLATTVPAGLEVDVTYEGSPSPPSTIGLYAVTAAVNEANYIGTAEETLSIASTDTLFQQWLQGKQGPRPLGSDLGPEADIDFDGMTGWEEFIADTDPYDRTSVLALEGDYVAAASDVETGTMRFTFSASSNRFYELLCSTNLFSPADTLNLGRGVPGMTLTNDSLGVWYGSIRVRLEDPAWP